MANVVRTCRHKTESQDGGAGNWVTLGVAQM